MKQETRCANCGKKFTPEEQETQEQERVDELKTNFPGVSVEDCVIVCDDCYRKASEKGSRRGA